MRPCGRGDDDGIHIAEQLVQVGGDQRARILPGEPLPRRLARIADGRELGVRQPRRSANVVAAPRPGADHAEPQPAHR